MLNSKELALAIRSFGSFTHKQLQKMCYYTQAWHLALMNEPISDAKFEAWVHGPVCPEIYKEYKQHGWCKIPKIDKSEINIDSDTYDFIENIVDTFSNFSGDELEDMTHSEEPWLKSRGNIEVWRPSTNIISNDSMKEYYKLKYEEAQND